MNKDDFVKKWNSAGDILTLRVVKFNGGSIFATAYQLQVMHIYYGHDEKTKDIDLVTLSKDVGGMVVETGSIELKKIKDVL